MYKKTRPHTSYNMNNGVKDIRQSVEKKNNGSSVAMEVEAAKMVFGRYVAIRKL